MAGETKKLKTITLDSAQVNDAREKASARQVYMTPSEAFKTPGAKAKDWTRATSLGGSSSRSGGMSWGDYQKYEQDYNTWKTTGKHGADFSTWSTQDGLDAWRAIRDRNTNGTQAALIGDRYYSMGKDAYDRYERDYAHWKKTGKHTDDFGTWAKEDELDNWRKIRDYNIGVASGKNPSMELQSTINGLDPDVLSAMQEAYRASWTYGTTEEDMARKAEGRMPKSKEKYYKNGTEFDRWLYSQGLPSTKDDYFQRLYNSYAEQIAQQRSAAQGPTYRYNFDGNDRATKKITEAFRSDWHYGNSAEDKARKRAKRMPKAVEELYTDSEIDQYYKSLGLPPAALIDDYVTEYNALEEEHAQTVHDAALTAGKVSDDMRVIRDQYAAQQAAQRRHEAALTAGAVSDDMRAIRDQYDPDAVAAALGALRGTRGEDGGKKTPIGTYTGGSEATPIGTYTGGGEKVLLENAEPEEDIFDAVTGAAPYSGERVAPTVLRNIERPGMGQRHRKIRTEEDAEEEEASGYEQELQAWEEAVQNRTDELAREYLDQDRVNREQKWMQDEGWQPLVESAVDKVITRNWTREDFEEEGWTSELEQVVLDYVFGESSYEPTETERALAERDARAQAESEIPRPSQTASHRQMPTGTLSERYAGLQEDAEQYGLGDKWAEYAALATKPYSEYTDADRAAAKAAAKAIEDAVPHSRYGAAGDAVGLLQVAEQLRTKSSKFRAGVNSFYAGFMNAFGIPWMIDQAANLLGKIPGSEALLGNSVLTAKEQASTLTSNAPIAGTAGNITGGVARMFSLRSLGPALKNIPGFVSLPAWLQRGLTSAYSYSKNSLVTSLFRTQTKAEWDAQEERKAQVAAEFGASYTKQDYDAWQQVGSVLKSAGLSAAGGLAGGVLGYGIQSGIGKFVYEHPALNTALTYWISNTVTGTAEGMAATGLGYLSYPEGQKVTGEQVRNDVLTIAAFSMFSAGLQTLNTVKAQKNVIAASQLRGGQQYYQDLVDRYTHDYAGYTTEEKIGFWQDLATRSEAAASDWKVAGGKISAGYTGVFRDLAGYQDNLGSVFTDMADLANANIQSLQTYGFDLNTPIDMQASSVAGYLPAGSGAASASGSGGAGEIGLRPVAGMNGLQVSNAGQDAVPSNMAPSSDMSAGGQAGAIAAGVISGSAGSESTSGTPGAIAAPAAEQPTASRPGPGRIRSRRVAPEEPNPGNQALAAAADEAMDSEPVVPTETTMQVVSGMQAMGVPNEDVVAVQQAASAPASIATEQSKALVQTAVKTVADTQLKLQEMAVKAAESMQLQQQKLQWSYSRIMGHQEAARQALEVSDYETQRRELREMNREAEEYRSAFEQAQIKQQTQTELARIEQEKVTAPVREAAAAVGAIVAQEAQAEADAVIAMAAQKTDPITPEEETGLTWSPIDDSAPTGYHWEEADTGALRLVNNGSGETALTARPSAGTSTPGAFEQLMAAGGRSLDTDVKAADTGITTTNEGSVLNGGEETGGEAAGRSSYARAVAGQESAEGIRTAGSTQRTESSAQFRKAAESGAIGWRQVSPSSKVTADDFVQVAPSRETAESIQRVKRSDTPDASFYEWKEGMPPAFTTPDGQIMVGQTGNSKNDLFQYKHEEAEWNPGLRNAGIAAFNELQERYPDAVERAVDTYFATINDDADGGLVNRGRAQAAKELVCDVNAVAGLAKDYGYTLPDALEAFGIDPDLGMRIANAMAAATGEAAPYTGEGENPMTQTYTVTDEDNPFRGEDAEALTQKYREAYEEGWRAPEEVNLRLAYLDAGDNDGVRIVDGLAETQFSVTSLANGVGLIAKEDRLVPGSYHLYDKKGNVVTEVHPKDLKGTPIGKLIDLSAEKGFIDSTERDRQYDMFAAIGSIVAKCDGDFARAQAFIGSSLFTAMKTNSDKQYSFTWDFLPICTKTQATIDAMSARMVAKGRGLTDDEILAAYKKANDIGLPVPCPECYVFSRWVGIGSLLDNIATYQNKYKGMVEQRGAHLYATQEAMDAYRDTKQAVLDAAEAAGLNPGKAKTKLADKAQKAMDKADNALNEAAAAEGVTDEELAPLREKYDACKDAYEKIKSLTWLEKVFFKNKDTGEVWSRMENGRLVDDFTVPSEVLFDLNRGGDFAEKYPRAWAFRTTQGAGYGKAITPYSDARAGEGIMVIAGGDKYIKGVQAGTAVNPFSDMVDGELSAEGRTKWNNAVAKELQQAWLGGQRWQSTSDARFENALDYLIAALDTQAMGSFAQSYTKVSEAVEMLAALGCYPNQSMMPFGNGLEMDADGNLVTDENGNYIPKDTSIGGMRPEEAKANRLKYEGAGTITIGVNDKHIRALMRSYWRDFIIPYHASGGKVDLIAEFRATQDKDAKGLRVRSSDYTRVQGEKVLSDAALKYLYMHDRGLSESEFEAKLAQIERNRECRRDLLQQKNRGKDASEATIASKYGDILFDEGDPNYNPILRRLYDRLHTEQWREMRPIPLDKIKGQIYPNEYWDQTTTYETSGQITRDYLDYCESLGFLHKFAGVIPAAANKELDAQGYKSMLRPVMGYDEHGEKVPLQDLAYLYDENGNKTDQIEDYFWKVLTDRQMYMANADETGSRPYQDQRRVTLGRTDAGMVQRFAAPPSKESGKRYYNRDISRMNAAEYAGMDQDAIDAILHGTTPKMRDMVGRMSGQSTKTLDQMVPVKGRTSTAEALHRDLAESSGPETHYGDHAQFSSRVIDKKELAFLDGQKTVRTYKTMQLIDGKLYPPMAAVVAGNMEDYSVLGQWEKATEHPELIKDGKFTLNKGKGKGSLMAAYNPYMHSSNLMINDQFSGAWDRPNLVTVECEVPESELTSGYHAEYAKDSVGWHSWHTGTVAGQLRNQKGTERQVLLSRWIKPVRIVPESEVAQHYAELLEGTDIEVPDNVVAPSLLMALKEAGVPIKISGKVKNAGTQFSGRVIVDYENGEERTKLKAKKHSEMVQAGKVIELTPDDMNLFSKYFPEAKDQSNKKDPTRKQQLKDARAQLPDDLRNMLRMEFLGEGKEVTFYIDEDAITARAYEEFVNHAVPHNPRRFPTQESAAALSRAREIMNNAEYVYSAAHDIHGSNGSTDVVMWDYFYCPIRGNKGESGVLISIRELGGLGAGQHQIYGWDKNKTALGRPALYPVSRTPSGKASSAVSKQSIQKQDDDVKPSNMAYETGERTPEIRSDIIGEVTGEKKPEMSSRRITPAMMNARINQLESMVERRDQKLKDQKAEAKAREKEIRQRNEIARQRQKARDKAIELHEWLTKPTKKDHVPIPLQEHLAGIVGNLDIAISERGDADARKFRKAVSGLKDFYTQYIAGVSDKYDFANFNATIPPATITALETIEEMTEGSERIGAMDLNQLKALNIVLGVSRSAVKNANQLLGSRRYKTVSELGKRTQEDAAGMKQRKIWKLKSVQDLTSTRMMDAFSWGRAVGKGGEAVIDELEQGFEKSYGKIREASEYAESIMEKHGVRKRDITRWSKDDLAVAVAGSGDQTVHLTTSQAMEIYALSKRPQALGHMLSGGIEIAALKNGHRQTEVYHLEQADIDSIIGRLTPEQKAFVDDMQSFLSETAAEWGNETWRRMYDYEMFGEENYWPIRSAARGVKTQDPDAARLTNAMLNMGITKALSPNATNPVTIGDAMDTWTGHVAQMARLNGLAIPIEDALKWFNWIGTDENGTRDWNATTKVAIDKVLGPEGSRYFIQLLKDVNGLSTGQTGTQLASELLSHYKRAAVAGKLRVVIQQPTAVIRAWCKINPTHFATLTAANIKRNIREMQQHSGLAWWKSQGNYDIGTGRSLKSVFFGSDGAIENITNAAMSPAGFADDFAWGWLWGAVKHEIAQKHPELEKGTDAYWQAVERRFADIVNETQVVDGVLQRSDLMRSKSGLDQMASAFMAEPTKSYNLIRNRIMDIRNGGGKKAWGELVKGLFALGLSIAVNSAVLSVHDTLKRRKRGDDFTTAFSDNFRSNALDDVLPWNYVPYIKDIASIMSGDSVERMDMSMIEDIWRAAKNGYKYFVEGDRSKTLYKILGDIASVGGAVAGIPTTGIMATFETIANGISPGFIKKTQYLDKDKKARLKEAGISYNDGYAIMAQYKTHDWSGTGAKAVGEQGLFLLEAANRAGVELSDGQFDILGEMIGIGASSYNPEKDGSFGEWTRTKMDKYLSDKDKKGELTDEISERYGGYYDILAELGY